MKSDDTIPKTQRPEAYWGAHAAEYDSFIVRVVPRYWEMMTRVLDYAPTEATRVLELGTGTGNLSLKLAQRWPAATFTFVDGAPEMLDVTRERLQEEAPRVARNATFLGERFEELQLEPRSLDVIVASLSLHHVQRVEQVYDRIAPALAANGRLIMLDGVRGETDAEHRVSMLRWRNYWLEPGNLSHDEVLEISQHVAQQDHYRSFSEHVAMLQRAGFVYADCVWRDGLFTLITAAAP